MVILFDKKLKQTRVYQRVSASIEVHHLVIEDNL
jgi:hypothetical protein